MAGLAAVAGMLAATPAAAQVPVCEALTLYGNALAEGLCRSLSPTTQNLWVCELASGTTDVHTTFNVATALHITVRINPGAPTCQGNANFGGNFPGALTLPVPIAPICNVNVASYLARLNAVAQRAAGAATACRKPFLDAMGAGRISAANGQTYLNTCLAQACP